MPSSQPSAPSHTPSQVPVASDSKACLSNKHPISPDLRFLVCKTPLSEAHLLQTGVGHEMRQTCGLGPGGGDHTLQTLLLWPAR